MGQGDLVSRLITPMTHIVTLKHSLYYPTYLDLDLDGFVARNTALELLAIVYSLYGWYCCFQAIALYDL